MSKKSKIALMIIVGPIMCLVYYRMFFGGFDKRNIVKYDVVLIKNPEYHGGAVRGSPSWYFKTDKNTFELDNINPLDISKQEIRQIKKGDSLTIYSYEYFSFSSFLRKSNNRIIIHGLKTGKLNKYYPNLIQQVIRDLDLQVFWSVHFLAILGGFAIYSRKKKNDTTNSA
ncbi:MAG: hypothetical protein ACK5B9_09435 [Flavobacteriia bacterium]|jgi:hypothetical protein